MYDMPEGFEVPIYRGPLRPKLSAGAPRDFSFLMLGVCLLSLFWKLWAVVPLTGFLQLIAVWGTRMDEKWFQKVPRVVRYKRYYKP
jgi:type IV secretory pathway TrbD component